MKVEIFKSDAVFFRTVSRYKWFVRLRAGNNQIMTTSKGYTRRWNAERAAKRMFPDVPIEFVD